MGSILGHFPYWDFKQLGGGYITTPLIPHPLLQCHGPNPYMAPMSAVAFYTQIMCPEKSSDM